MKDRPTPAERPTRGGSYIREEDGRLRRVAHTAEPKPKAAPGPPVPAPADAGPVPGPKTGSKRARPSRAGEPPVEPPVERPVKEA